MAQTTECHMLTRRSWMSLAAAALPAAVARAAVGSTGQTARRGQWPPLSAIRRLHRQAAGRQPIGGLHRNRRPHRRADAGDDARNEVLRMHLRPARRSGRHRRAAAHLRPGQRNAVCRAPRDRVDVRAGRRRRDRSRDGKNLHLASASGPRSSSWSGPQKAQTRSAAVCVDDAAEAGVRPHAERAGRAGGGARLDAVGACVPACCRRK